MILNHLKIYEPADEILVPLKYIMDNPIFIAFICMGKPIQIQRAKRQC